MILKPQMAPLFNSSIPSAFFPQDLTWDADGLKQTWYFRRPSPSLLSLGFVSESQGWRWVDSSHATPTRQL